MGNSEKQTELILNCNISILLPFVGTWCTFKYIKINFFVIKSECNIKNRKKENNMAGSHVKLF